MYIYIKKNISTDEFFVEKGYYFIDNNIDKLKLDGSVRMIKCDENGNEVKIKSKYDSSLITVQVYLKKHMIDYICSDYSKLSIVTSTFKKVEKEELRVKPCLKLGILHRYSSDSISIVVGKEYKGSILPNIIGNDHIYFFKPLLVDDVVYISPVRLSRATFTCGIVFMTRVNTMFRYEPGYAKGIPKDLNKIIVKSFYDNLLAQIMRITKINCLLFSTDVKSFQEKQFQKNYKASFSEKITTTENYSYNQNSGNRIVTVCINKC